MRCRLVKDPQRWGIVEDAGSSVFYILVPPWCTIRPELPDELQGRLHDERPDSSQMHASACEYNAVLLLHIVASAWWACRACVTLRSAVICAVHLSRRDVLACTAFDHSPSSTCQVNHDDCRAQQQQLMRCCPQAVDPKFEQWQHLDRTHTSRTTVFVYYLRFQNVAPAVTSYSRVTPPVSSAVAGTL